MDELELEKRLELVEERMSRLAKRTCEVTDRMRELAVRMCVLDGGG